MLEFRSPLANARPYKSNSLVIHEVTGFSLIQAAGMSSDFEKKLSAILGKLPARAGIASSNDDRTLMRVGPTQFWLVGPQNDKIAAGLQKFCAVTPLSHSRTRIRLEGTPARDVLAKGIALDWHESVFKPGMFAMTGLHHTPVLVHCLAPDCFEIYALRTFALSVWEWLCDAALEFSGP